MSRTKKRMRLQEPQEGCRPRRQSPLRRRRLPIQGKNPLSKRLKQNPNRRASSRSPVLPKLAGQNCSENNDKPYGLALRERTC